MDDRRSAGQPAFLNVEKSLGGKRWRPRLVDERRALAISQKFALPDVLGRVLAARGVDIGLVEGFLNPKLRNLLPDPAHLLDMDKAVERLVSAIHDGETIGIFADYDVDGACSASILARFFASIGREVMVYVPDRVREGYGPNVPGLLKLKDSGVSLVLTVDCGTTAFEPLACVADAGLDVIVIDHHIAEPQLPAALAVVNPNRLDETSPLGQLCAAVVTFMLIIALNRALRESHWYGEGHNEPKLIDWLDLVALATVADVVPLSGINRALVRQGLSIMARRGNAGIAALVDVAGVEETLEAWHLGFMLGPRVNAGGRVGEAGLGAQILTTTDHDTATGIAMRLDQYNTERRQIEAGVLDSAMAQAEQQAKNGVPLIVVAAGGWHPGVIGIVAGRIKDTFNLPTCVISLESGLGKGSGRSVQGVDLGSAVIAAHQAGHLHNGGGHAMAAGFVVAVDNLSKFKNFMEGHIIEQLSGKVLVPEIGIDAALTPEAGSVELFDSLNLAGPFGAGNPRPRFVLPSVTPVSSNIVGSNHIRCFLQSTTGGRRIKAIAFRIAGTPAGNMLINARGSALHVAGHLNIDSWKGERRTQFVIEDVARAG
ncbi:MAG: single-stranded-DNA-specific exonuclease RecJ [Pseudomonadota bacterium]|nr:single-stranded-DNA-specific exonuclease RecJ [Pseudomonadota bacterium]